MNTVQPIRDKSIIEKFKNELLKKEVEITWCL